MHKPVRPKSAKGHSRTTHPVVDRGERKSSTSTSSVFSKSGSQQQHSGPGSTSQAYQHSETATSLRPTAAQSRTSRSFSSRDITETQTAQNHSTTPSEDLFAQSKVEKEVNFPAIERPTSSLSKYHILPAISPSALTSQSAESNSGSSVQSAENEVDLLTEKAQQMILDSALQRMGPRKKTPPNGSYKRKVSKSGELDRKRAKVHQTRSVFASSGVSRPVEKPKVPREPGPKEESLLIALKLPDGTRKERRFLPNTKIHGILVYAHTQYPIIPISQCNVFRMDIIPKKLLSELDSTLQELKIQNRTVLYIEENEDL